MDLNLDKERLINWFTKSEKREISLIISLVVGISILIANFLFLKNIPAFEGYFPLINIIGVFVATGPMMMIKYNDYKRKKEIERRFPFFLRNVTEGSKAGMTLPKALKEAAEGDYGALNPHTKKMASQIDWGIPFDEVLKRFSDRVGSDTIGRTVTTIIEAHRSGGNVSEVLQVVGESVTQMERIKKERKSHVYSQMVTGYTIYFVFLGVMIGLQRFLIPSLTMGGEPGMTVEAGAGLDMEGLVAIYEDMFQNLIIIQGLFSGLAIGKMSSGSVIAGLQHVLVLVVVGYTAFFMFI